MTPNEEKNYLTNLLIEATAWKVTEGESRSPIELEVIDRLRRLNGMPTVNVEGVASDDIPESNETEQLNEDDYKELEAAKLNDYLEKRRAQNRKAKEKDKQGKTRVTIDGKLVWRPLSECRKVPRWPNRPDSDAWKWKYVGPQQEVDKLSDELWAEHENKT